MKRILATGMLALASMFLAACAFKGNPYPNTDQTNETWPAYVQTNPNAWANGADRWFYTGDPNVTEEQNMNASSKEAVSTMMVRVTDFNKIKVDGSFQVQLFGTVESNSVYLYGPNNEVRQVAIEVQGDTLCIHSTDKSANLDKVIVRVGVANLNSLVQMGCGRIEGRQLRSTGLDITSSGAGKMNLAGNVYLRRITQNGSGAISVFGAVSQALEIKTTKTGGVNVSGNIGIRNITHSGQNEINIIGANGGNAKIYTEGSGKIGIYGSPNITEITAKDETCVYSYCVHSGSLYVYVSGKSKVGLAGSASDLYVETSGRSQFSGRDLITSSAYVRANGSSHINVTARDKVYAASTGSSSVYFFGSPNMLSQFLSGDGTVIPIWFDRPSHYQMCPVYAVKGMYKDSCEAPRSRRSHHRDVNRYVK
jgi:hypothetical protein